MSQLRNINANRRSPSKKKKSLWRKKIVLYVGMIKKIGKLTNLNGFGINLMVLLISLNYVPLVVNTSRSFPRSRLITGFVTRLTRRVEQELLTLPEHLSSPPCFSGIHVNGSLPLCVCFVDRCLSFCHFFVWSLCCLSFDLRILITPSVSRSKLVFLFTYYLRTACLKY